MIQENAKHLTFKQSPMIPAGYLYKKIEKTPDWLNNSNVREICSVSDCTSGMHDLHHPYAGITNQAKMANSLEDIRQAAKTLDTTGLFEGYDLFYYEMYEKEFDEESLAWSLLSPNTIPDSVMPPRSAVLLGYDAAVFQEDIFPVGCSPLSCNHLAENLAVNEYCLFPTLDDAIRVLNDGGFARVELGPYRLYAVYRVEEA